MRLWQRRSRTSCRDIDPRVYPEGVTDEQRAALALAEGRQDRPAEIERVARQTSPEAAAWAFQQWALRERGRVKFSGAAEMLFDRDGLEMATHEALAAYHASRFPSGVPVLDMTAGIGADTLALAMRGTVLACEKDADRAALLEFNLGATVFVGDGRDRLGEFDYVWADPMRRGGGARLKPADYEPNPWELKEEFAAKKLVGVKLSPMAGDDLLLDLGVGIEFLSFRGECREAVAWCGQEAKAGVWAVQVETGERRARVDEPGKVEEAGGYVYEGDPAAIRAHALGGFGMARLGDSPGYLTGDGHVVSPWLTAYEVLWQGPLRLARVQDACREQDLFVEAVKKRGVDIDPPVLQRQIKAKGGTGCVVFVYGFQKRQRVLLTKKLGTP
jgi:hypothetical protein